MLLVFHRSLEPHGSYLSYGTNGTNKKIRLTSSRSGAAHFISQPGAGKSPIAHNSAGRNLKHIGSLFDAQPAKKSQLDNSALALINSFKSLQSVVQRNDIGGLFLSCVGHFIEGHLDQAAAAFGRVSFAGLVDEDMPHQPRRDPKKMAAILESHLRLVHQAQISLVD